MSTPSPAYGQAVLEGRLAELGLLAIEPQPASATGLAVPGECLLAGWSFAESTGAAVATVDLFDGSGVGGAFLGRVDLAAGASREFACPYPGVHCENGLFVNVVAGAVLGAVYAVVV
jgi:hypothetical protein